VSDWFENWFGEEYIALYPHRDEEEARVVATLIAEQVQLPNTARVLDLACGAGRHQRELCDHWWTVGLDLSPALLRVARSQDRANPLVRADMRRLPFATGALDMVVNLFTSFGYFRDDAQHRVVIQEVARVTRKRGWFVLDFLNAPQVRSTLVPFDRTSWF
jgi:SAM-dependent methyltransferase